MLVMNGHISVCSAYVSTNVVLTPFTTTVRTSDVIFVSVAVAPMTFQFLLAVTGVSTTFPSAWVWSFGECAMLAAVKTDDEVC